MVICPGIGNHSEKHYIRTFVDYAQKEGYRCAVLNHLGALPNIELTSPRMFTYGESEGHYGLIYPLGDEAVVLQSLESVAVSVSCQVLWQACKLRTVDNNKRNMFLYAASFRLHNVFLTQFALISKVPG